MRLAMMYALLDQSRLIRAEHLTAALALHEYVEASVRFIWGDALGNPVADDILRMLRGCPAGMTRTDLYNALGKHTAANKISTALALLAEHQLARCESKATGGRPEERWYPGRKR